MTGFDLFVIIIIFLFLGIIIRAFVAEARVWDLKHDEEVYEKYSGEMKEQ